jgi:hypothetical protein
MARIRTTGTVRTWDLGIRTDGTLSVTAYDADGAIMANNIISFAVNGTTSAITFEVSVSGSTITRRIVVTTFTPGLTVQDVIVPSASSDTLTGTSVGTVTTLQLGDGTADLGGLVMGHPAISDDLNGYANTATATMGWNGEPARHRLLRLASEENVPLSVAMADAALPQMGVQQSSTFIDLIRQAETVDQGILFERRDGTELAYRAAGTLLNQQPVLTLDFEDGIFDDIRPKDDDRAAFNAMTAKRINGSEFTYELAEGANSIQDPPDGIGYYGTTVPGDLSLAFDADLPDQAAWRVHVATVDQMRYPVITLNLANERAFALLDDVLRADVGDKIRLTNLPPDYSVDDVDLLVWGTSDAPSPDAWPVSFVCVPAEPWTAAVIDSLLYGRADTDGSELTAAATSTQTTVGVLTTAENRWAWSSAFPGEFPFDVRAGGEVWTVTGIASAFTDAFGRTASNGWGSSDSGASYSTGGGSTSDFSVGSGYGVHVLSTVNASRRTFISDSIADFDFYGSIAVSATATGGSLYGALAGRYTDVSNVYLARLEFTTAGTLVLSVRKRVGGTETQLGTYNPGISYSAGTFYRVRFRGNGTRLRAKVWAVTDPEPGQWQIIVFDSSLTTSVFLGVYSISAAGNTNGASVQIRYDNLELVNPQVFTVTRSVNGVVVAHDAGTDVRLARPAYLAPKES